MMQFFVTHTMKLIQLTMLQLTHYSQNIDIESVLLLFTVTAYYTVYKHS